MRYALRVGRLPALLVLCAAVVCALDVQLLSTSETPLPVGTTVHAVARTTGASAGVWYRFRVRGPESAEFRMVRDFGPSDTLQWFPGLREGRYELEVTARDQQSGATSVEVTSYTVVPRATNGEPALSATANELVFLYSAPPCVPGSSMIVRFEAPDGTMSQTPAAECVDGVSLNFLLAGMRPATEYNVHHLVAHPDGSAERGPDMKLVTGDLSFEPAPTIARLRLPGSSEEGILYQNRLFEYPVATDMEGNIVWYLQQTVPYLVGAQPGGYFFALLENTAGVDTDQLLRLVDLAGNVLLETNAARVNEQLDAMGVGRMTSFHHDARRLPDGHILVLAANERMIADVQGPGEVPVIGDMILVLNQDLEVQWAWDAFDHLDVSRKALLDEKCERAGGGCPVYYSGGVANDWLHGNSVALTPDGHIVYSSRHQDWIVKIDYANGEGSGNVIWRLGQDGDFALRGPARGQWFSHQHDATFINDTDLLLFDNANTRRYDDSSVHSRGQVYRIDEQNRTATLLFDVDLGDYAFALGSAQQLSNGNLHFGLGWTSTAPPGSHSLEYTPDGRLVSKLEAATQQYRSLRMRSLYQP